MGLIPASSVTTVDFYTCDSCGHERQAKLRELAAEGWVRHGTKNSSTYFLMCNACEDMYAKRRQMRKQLEAGYISEQAA